jgi:CHAT domain-containing protein
MAGALAYIGTMWSVEDSYAARFAADFYAQLKTKTIGEALKQSRINARSSEGESFTWAPYTFYGDPRHNIR